MRAYDAPASPPPARRAAFPCPHSNNFFLRYPPRFRPRRVSAFFGASFIGCFFKCGKGSSFGKTAARRRFGKTESAPGGVIWKEEGVLRKLPFFVSKKGKSRTAGEIIDNFLCFFKKLWTAAAGYDILKQSGRGQDVFLVGGGIWYTKTERPKPLRKRFVSFVWKSVSLPSI